MKMVEDTKKGRPKNTWIRTIARNLKRLAIKEEKAEDSLRLDSINRLEFNYYGNHIISIGYYHHYQHFTTYYNII